MGFLNIIFTKQILGKMAVLLLAVCRRRAAHIVPGQEIPPAVLLERDFDRFFCAAYVHKTTSRGPLGL